MSVSNFVVNGLKFKFINSDYQLHKTTEDEIIVLKDRDFLDRYAKVFLASPRKSVLEFGVFEGGSLIYFALNFPDMKFVGIDIRPPNPAVLDHIKRLGLEDRVKIYYGVSQTDKNKIHEIIANDFGGEPLGVVIDDASHNYSFSRRTFELTFGKIAPGGFYCLEDWAWAHWGEPYQTQQWTDQPALTNLLFEILILEAAVHGMIKNIEVVPALAIMERGYIALGEFQIDAMLRMRGKKLTLI